MPPAPKCTWLGAEGLFFTFFKGLGFRKGTRGEAQVDLPAGGSDAMVVLFAEELGLLLEVAPQHEEHVAAAYRAAGLPVTSLGSVTSAAAVSIAVGGQQHISGAPPAPQDPRDHDVQTLLDCREP